MRAEEGGRQTGRETEKGRKRGGEPRKEEETKAGRRRTGRDRERAGVGEEKGRG